MPRHRLILSRVQVRYERIYNAASQFPEATPDALLGAAEKRVGPQAIVVLRSNDEVGAFIKRLVGLHAL